MRNEKIKIRICLLIILSIVLSEMCFNEQPFITYSSATQNSEINSSVYIHIDRVKRVIGEERFRGSAESADVIRRTGRRVVNSFLKKTPYDLTFVDYLPQNHHSTTVRQRDEVSGGTSAHLAMIRCIYRKDGKKRDVL